MNNLNCYWDDTHDNLVKWDRRFLNLAREFSTWSKDPSTKVGAVIIDPNRKIVTPGYNGFPAKLLDDPKFFEDRDLKLSRMIHAEMNAIFNAAEQGKSVKNCCIYVYGMTICSKCTLNIIATGISRVVFRVPINANKKNWEVDWKIAKELFKEAKIEYVEYT